MTTLFLILAVLSGTIVLLMNRIEHAIIYDDQAPGYTHKALRWWKEGSFLGVKGIHKSGDILYGGLGLCIFFALMSQGWGVKGIAGAACLSLAPYWLVSPFGQAYVNMGSGLKADPGLWRKVKPIVGVAAIAAGVMLWSP